MNDLKFPYFLDDSILAGAIKAALLPFLGKMLTVAFALVITLVTVSCAQGPVKTTVIDALSEAELASRDKKKHSRSGAVPSEVPSEVREELLNPAAPNPTKVGPKREGRVAKRFDISVNDIAASSFFTNLMSATATNIIVHPDISGNITLNLKQVSIEELLTVVRDVYGYAYKYENNIYTVYSKKLRTEIFPINYIDVKRVGVSDTSVLTGNIQSSSQASSESDQSNQAADLLGSGNTITPGSRIQTRTEADFWGSLRLSIAEIIGTNESLANDQSDSQIKNQSKVIVNPQAGIIVVTAMPDKLESVRGFLDRAQLNIKKQVIIEAKILEIELSKGYEAGVNWDQINGQLLLGNNVSEFSSPNNIDIAAEGVGEVFSSLIKVADLSKLLSLLQTQGNVQVLSSPRIATVNNQKAVIRVGTDRFFVTDISNTVTTSSGSTTNNPDVELSSFFSGISLDVTPQISNDNEVILHIHPVISTVTEELKELAVGDSAFSLPLALRDIRESDSIVRADNGQIIVLGGLMQEKSVDSNGKRPILGDIPLLNSFFKTTRKSQVKSELIILLKPTIVEDDSWNKNLTESKNRLNKWQNATEF